MWRMEDVAEHEIRSGILRARAVRQAERGNFGRAAYLSTRSDIQHAEAIGAAINPYHYRRPHPGMAVAVAETAVVAGASAGLVAAELTAVELSRQRCREMEMQAAMNASVAAAAYRPSPYAGNQYYPPPVEYPAMPPPAPGPYPAVYPQPAPMQPGYPQYPGYYGGAPPAPGYPPY